MPGQELQSARVVAVEVLNRFDRQHNHVGSILSQLLKTTWQRQRATDLVMGTIRNRVAIDAVIGMFSGRSVRRIQTKILNIIRVAVYELTYNPQTPDYSIVNEAVENTCSIAGKKQTGFVNAVLREIARHITGRQTPLNEADTQATIPQNPSTGCQFDVDFLPDPEISPADYFAATFSLPKWLVEGWLYEFGKEFTRQICFACNRKPSIYLRPNRLKITTAALADLLCEKGIEVEIAPDAEMIKVKSPRSPIELPGFGQGFFSIQDITASRAVKMLKPRPDWTILDLCAAPGTKTMQLAEETGDCARIFATDINSTRLQKVGENIARLGSRSVHIVAYDLIKDKGPFDAVLLDVPCSNTGVLARRPEVRYKIKQKAIMQLARIQVYLLTRAAAMLKSNGKICYSTCSIQKSENHELIRQFLQNNPDFDLQVEELFLPSANPLDQDGGYVSILQSGRLA